MQGFYCCTLCGYEGAGFEFVSGHPVVYMSCPVCRAIVHRPERVTRDYIKHKQGINESVKIFCAYCGRSEGTLYPIHNSEDHKHRDYATCIMVLSDRIDQLEKRLEGD